MTHRENIFGSFHNATAYYRENRIGRTGVVAEDIFHGTKVKTKNTEDVEDGHAEAIRKQREDQNKLVIQLRSEFQKVVDEFLLKHEIPKERTSEYESVIFNALDTILKGIQRIIWFEDFLK